MPDKLTDNEIIKALRSWLEKIRESRQAYLEKTNIEHYPSMRYEYLLSDTIHELNRLKAENSNLQEKNSNFTSDLISLQNDLTCLQAEKEQYKANSDSRQTNEYKNIDIAHIKAEAYKEFAELLHCQCESIINQPHNENVRPISWKFVYEEFDEKIDNLLKEMVGDTDA